MSEHTIKTHVFTNTAMQDAGITLQIQLVKCIMESLKFEGGYATNQQQEV